jgi:DNA (cytosine-5)-methyltransferase 1
MSISVVSLFSGIGAYEKALKNLGVEFRLEAYCELDPKTSKCYSIIHGSDESKNLKDVKEIDAGKIGEIDLLVYSPPCQDISTAGRHAGINDSTRTGLMWNVVDLIKDKRPKWIVMENVKNLQGRYKPVLDDYVRTVEKLGYKCSCQVLNGKDHGTPQNRQRLFMVGTRTDLDQKFDMPAKRPLGRLLKDLLKDVNVKTIDKEVSYTIRLGGRKSKVGNKHNWDGYIVNGKEYYLTAKDCLLLMGFDEGDYAKLKEAGVSEGKIAKMAGNSIVVSVLEDIFRNLLKDHLTDGR